MWNIDNIKQNNNTALFQYVFLRDNLLNLQKISPNLSNFIENAF